MTEKDALFAVDHIREDFVFNDRIANVFDDMVARSIPFYQEVIKSAAQILDCRLQPGETVCDLGCSTGSALLEISRLLAAKKLRCIGIDSSAAMLKKARQKAEMFATERRLELRCGDIRELAEKELGAVLLNYTLQFLRPLDRTRLLQRIFDSLRPGGVLLLSEKTVLSEERLNRDFISIYHQFKKARGYSELEIARKREALENVLIPFTTDENISLLVDTGFSPVTPFFQWFNFCSLLAVKPENSAKSNDPELFSSAHLE